MNKIKRTHGDFSVIIGFRFASHKNVHIRKINSTWRKQQTTEYGMILSFGRLLGTIQIHLEIVVFIHF